MLYKYIGNKEPAKVVDYLKRFVIDGTIKATIPIEFNDPAEFKVKFSFNATEHEKAERFSQLWPKASIQERSFWVKSRAEHIEYHDAMMLRAGLLQKAGVICLTFNPTDFLMWSHYAHSHTGFCIGFKESLIDDLVTPDCVAYDYVYYEKEPPVVNFYNSDETDIGRALFMHKSPVWKYEKEYRLVFENAGVRKFSRSSIKEVVLGCRASEELISCAKELIGSGIEVYQMRESPYNYSQEKIKL